MNRSLAFLAALMCAAVTISSACAAQTLDGIGFSLRAERDDPAKLHATFREDRNANWSTGVMPSDLIGLEVSSFRASGSRPLHFAIVRDAGRLECVGSGGNAYASGACRFTADQGYARLLERQGIGHPTREQSFTLLAVNARRTLIQAIAAARYPAPSIGDVVALSALDVDGRFIGEMARAGYRPQTIRSLIEFKALGIDPQWIGGFTRIGYANVPSEGLVQMRALGITPDFITGYRQLGYGNLPTEKLVELKTLNITPAFVRSVTPAGHAVPRVSELVELKLFGRTMASRQTDGRW